MNTKFYGEVDKSRAVNDNSMWTLLLQGIWDAVEGQIIGIHTRFDELGEASQRKG